MVWSLYKVNVKEKKQKKFTEKRDKRNYRKQNTIKLAKVSSDSNSFATVKVGNRTIKLLQIMRKKQRRNNGTSFCP